MERGRDKEIPTFNNFISISKNSTHKNHDAYNHRLTSAGHELFLMPETAKSF
jgi:hypothetical protein